MVPTQLAQSRSAPDGHRSQRKIPRESSAIVSEAKLSQSTVPSELIARLGSSGCPQSLHFNSRAKKRSGMVRILFISESPLCLITDLSAEVHELEPRSTDTEPELPPFTLYM